MKIISCMRAILVLLALICLSHGQTDVNEQNRKRVCPGFCVNGLVEVLFPVSRVAVEGDLPMRV